MYNRKKTHQKQLDRLLIYLMECPKGATYKQICKYLGVCYKTAKRYISDLRIVFQVVDLRGASNKHSKFSLLVEV